MSLRPLPVSLRPIAVAVATFTAASLFVASFRRQSPPPLGFPAPTPTRSFVLWLHGLGDSGPSNEPIRSFFSSPDFNRTEWSFPSAPPAPVSCNNGAVMPSWFDIYEIPVTADSPKNEHGVLEAVQMVHAIIDKKVATGINTESIFVCGFSQGGALTVASILLYPRTLGGGAVFSGWIPFNSSIITQISAAAKMTPVLWSHGMADRVVSFKAGQTASPFLEQAGVGCEFKAYPNLGHTIAKEELVYLAHWIKGRLKSSS